MKPSNFLYDTIIYTVVTEPGGVDGRDPDDKGGTVVLATFDKITAENKVKTDKRYRVERSIVDNNDLVRAYAKLDPIDRLLIVHDIKTFVPKMR